MKKIAILVTLALGASGLLAGPVQAAQGEQEVQATSGNIKFLTRFTDGEGAFPGLARRMYLVAAEANGILGYVLPVEPDTWGGRFDVTVDGQQAVPGDADLGVYLYSDLGDIATQARQPVTLAEYDVRAPGGEKGFIPPETTYAIVFMSRGVDVNFTYRGFSPMSAEVSEAGFAPAEVTVGAGGYVRWTNAGQDFHSVTSTDGDFDSSPTMKQPLRPGEDFMVLFETVDDFTYFDRFGQATGVVHVVPGPGVGTPAA